MSVSNISGLRTKVSARIKDTASKLSITPDMTCDVDLCILSALEEYQSARPLVNVVLLTGNGGFDYAVSSLSTSLGSFVDGASVITEVIYPYSAAEAIQSALEHEEYEIRRLASGLFLRFLNAKPAASEQFQVTFTSPHSIDATHFTPSQGDVEALADLSAAYCCYALAGFYSQTTDNGISADAVNRITKAGEYRAQGKAWRASYKSKLFSGEAGSTGAASAVATFDTVMSNDIDRYQFHGRRFR